MRPSALATLAAFALFSTLVSAAATAHADGDDLPTGTDPPRVLPLASADVYYAYHDTPPESGDATLMTSPARHNRFQVGLVSIGATLEHAKLMGTAILQAGTAADALYPTNVNINRETLTHLQEANVGWRFSQDVSILAGLFPSHFGNESFPTFGNWNYSHAMISDATPYYLAGVKVKWNASSTIALTALVYNGWQALDDANDYKSGGLRIDWTPTDWLAIFDSVSIGPEQSDRRIVRYFDDFVIKVAPHPRLSAALEAYGGLDHFPDSTITGIDSASMRGFFGAAVWLRWFFGETTYVALRGEHIEDTHGLLVGCGANTVASSCGPDQGPKLWGGTITFGWQPHPNFLVRLEGVHRRSDVPFFAAASDSVTGGVVGVRDQSTTFSASMAFSY
jgi:hypothetical protein